MTSGKEQGEHRKQESDRSSPTVNGRPTRGGVPSREPPDPPQVSQSSSQPSQSPQSAMVSGSVDSKPEAASGQRSGGPGRTTKVKTLREYPRSALPAVPEEPTPAPQSQQVFDDPSEVGAIAPVFRGNVLRSTTPDSKLMPPGFRVAEAEGGPRGSSREPRTRAQTLREIPRHALAEAPWEFGEPSNRRSSPPAMPAVPARQPPAPPNHPALPKRTTLRDEPPWRRATPATLPAHAPVVSTTSESASSGILDASDWISPDASVSSAVTGVFSLHEGMLNDSPVADEREAQADEAAFVLSSPAEESARLHRATLNLERDAAAKPELPTTPIMQPYPTVAAANREFEAERPVKRTGLYAVLALAGVALVAISAYQLGQNRTSTGVADGPGAPVDAAQAGIGPALHPSGPTPSVVAGDGTPSVGEPQRIEPSSGSSVLPPAHSGSTAPSEAADATGAAWPTEAPALASRQNSAPTGSASAPALQPSANPDQGRPADSPVARPSKKTPVHAEHDGGSAVPGPRERTKVVSPTGSVSIASFELGYAQADGGCIGAGATVSLSQGGDVFACFTANHRAFDEEIRVIWRRHGEVRRRSVFELPADIDAQPIRAALPLSNEDMGDWVVQVIGPGGKLFLTRNFQVGP